MQEMRIRRRKRGGSEKVKMPKIEFDSGAIKEIKKRKKRSNELCKDHIISPPMT